MTKAQENGYWGRWKAVYEEFGYRTTAEKEERRHALHVEALGYDKSHKAFTRDEIDGVFALFDTLANPGDLEKARRYEAWKEKWDRTGTGTGGRESRLRLLKFYDAEAVAKICRNGYDATRPEDLDDDRLRKLVYTVTNKLEKKPVEAAANEPF